MSRKPFIRPVQTTSWWLNQGRYIRYMIREATCILIGAYSAVLIVGLIRLGEGKIAYEAYLAAVQSPMGMMFHIVALAFALYHTTSWFNVTPKAMPLTFADKRVPGGLIIGAHYAGWIVISGIALFLVGA